mgnify:FL=1
MKRLAQILLVALVTSASLLVPQAAFSLTTPVVAPQQRGGGGGGRGGGGDDGASSDGPKEYSEVITEDAVTKLGMFDVHEVDDKLYFEIPTSELNVEMLLIQRSV